MVNTTACRIHLERALPKMSRLERGQNVVAPLALPTHQIGLGHENCTGALITTRPARQTIQLGYRHKDL
jgi:hypothetical protein